LILTELELTRSVIQQLDDLTIGQIAAGEVVERPAQVVKELVENSIDAGAQRIRVEITRGGFDRITVIDDGHGIPSEELKLAITRHATSKLSGPEDLAKILTKGFRGEALASIGSVSELTVSSRPSGSVGNSIIVDNGIIGTTEPAGIAPGTRIDVVNIFEKVPARLSFQRRPATETAAIIDVGISLALSEPGTGIIIVVDGRTVLDCPPSAEMEDRLYDLFGATSAKLIELETSSIDNQAPGEERWIGWISPPGLTRSRSDDIHVIVNGRPVSPGPFLQAVRRGYHSRLMIGRHPIGVLSLNLPANEVDVNVHPTKREVRLRNSWRVLERLERAIKHTLSKVATQPESADNTILEGIDKVVIEEKITDEIRPSWAEAIPREMTQTHFSSLRHAVEKTPAATTRRPDETQTEQSTLPGLDPTPITSSLSSEERTLHRLSALGEAKSPLDEPTPDAAVIPELPEMIPLGQFTDSYILAEGDDELFIIDQHALHERIRYERLRSQMVNWDGQQLVTPLHISLGAREAASARSQSARLTELGISINESAEGFVIHSLPEVLIGKNSAEDFVHDLLIEISSQPESSGVDAVENLRDKVAFMRSCRGAVKANQKHNLAEMRRLLADMRTVANPWACVHGRPTILRLSLGHLDKHFGRHG